MATAIETDADVHILRPTVPFSLCVVGTGPDAAPVLPPFRPTISPGFGPRGSQTRTCRRAHFPEAELRNAC